MTAEQPGAPLPGREPHSLLVHAAVVAAVAFLALVIVMFILGVAIWVTIVVSLVIGAIAAPFTRRAEIDALAERAANPPPV